MSYLRLRIFAMARYFYSEYFYSVLAKCLIVFLIFFPESVWVGFAKLIESNVAILIGSLFIIIKMIDIAFYRKQLLTSEIKDWEISLPISKSNQIAIHVLDKLIAHTPAALTINAIFLFKYGISNFAFALLLKLDITYIAVATAISSFEVLLDKIQSNSFKIDILSKRHRVNFTRIWLVECLIESPIRILIYSLMTIATISFSIYRMKDGVLFIMTPLFTLPLLSLLDLTHSLLRQKYEDSRVFFDSLPLKRNIVTLFAFLDIAHSLFIIGICIISNQVAYIILLPNFVLMKIFKRFVPKYYILIQLFLLFIESSLIYRISL